MASIASHFSIFFLFSLLLSPFHIHARDSQFFSKIPSNNNVVNKAQTALIPQEQQQPNFIQESENGGYGLYGRESTTNLPYQAKEEIPNKKYLPKNYNPVSYVTVPEDNATPTPTTAAAAAKNQYYRRGKQQTSMPSDTFMQSGYTNGGKNYFNNHKQSFPSATTAAGNQYNQNNGGGNVQKQGMSDTRFLDGGRYYYNGEIFPRNPIGNSRNEFGNNRNFNEKNNNFMENSYEEFEDEDDDDLP